VTRSRDVARGIFITGPDTGVGKTFVAAALLRALAGAGYRAVGMKPVAAGLALGETVHGDARALIAAGNVAAAPADVNPFVFAPPIAPELAARAAGVTIDFDRIAAATARLAMWRRSSSKCRQALVPLGRSADVPTFRRAWVCRCSSRSASGWAASITRCFRRSQVRPAAFASRAGSQTGSM
jgi:hypothetical protein